MKKLFLILGLYSIIAFIVIVVLAFFVVQIPVLVDGTKNAYIFMNGLYAFLICLPGIWLSGFTVACSILWKGNFRRVQARFTEVMFSRFKIILFSSLALILVLSLNQEIFKPSAFRKIKNMESAAKELSSALVLSKRFYNQHKPLLAIQYARKALQINPKDKIAKDLLDDAEDKLKILKDMEIHGKQKLISEKIEKPLHKADESYTILELLKKSDEAAEKKEWFNAHYWAHLALEACDGKNTNLSVAQEKSNYSWKMLSEPKEFDNSFSKNYYKTKKEGYAAFVQGDFLKSYYIFLRLENSYEEAKKDPDVQKFLSLANEEVENQYFFFDEIEYMNELSNSKDIYFSLSYPDGSKNVFYISKAMDIKREGSLIRYLEDFYVVHYDENKNFIYSMFVPYAKAVAVPVSEFGESNFLHLGINKNWKYIPAVTLQSVDRNSDSVILKPTFSFNLTGLPKEILENEKLQDLSNKGEGKSFYNVENKSSMVLPMPFSDFHLINEASSGAKNMTLLALNKFLPSAAKYGFSQEIFVQNFVQRASFPFLLLIMFVFCASIGWNYRLESEKTLFKFKWIIAIPFFSLIMAVVINAVLYFFNMLNYVLVGIFGTFAFLAAIIIYVLLFLASSILFLSRIA